MTDPITLLLVLSLSLQKPDVNVTVQIRTEETCITSDGRPCRHVIDKDTENILRGINK